MLQNEAVVVRLSVSQWTGRKFDKKVTQKIADEYQVGEEVGRYRKVLVAEDAIRAITQSVSAIRAYHYENTLPWDDAGGRLLPADNFMDYTKKLRELKSEFDKAVGQFVDKYDDYRAEAENRLKGMFNYGDYPGSVEIRHRYNVSTDFEPVPDEKDFRVNLQESDMKRIQKDLKASIKSREKDAIYELYVRLNTALSRMAEKLGDSDAIFRDTLVENVIDLVNLMPKLNVTNDPKLEKLRKETEKKLCAYSPSQLREDESARDQAADDAQAIVDKMAVYMKV